MKMQISQSGAPPSGVAKTFRVPLDHPEIELIAQRVQVLLDLDGLTDFEFGTLLKAARDIKKADRCLARILYGQPLPHVSLRPLFWDDWHRPAHLGASAGNMADVMAGWVHRVAEFVARLEQKYGVRGEEDEI